AVGAAATGLVVFVFALFAPVLAPGAPHAAKNVAAAANKTSRVIFFITILLRYCSISKGEFNLPLSGVIIWFFSAQSPRPLRLRGEKRSANTITAETQRSQRGCREIQIRRRPTIA